MNAVLIQQIYPNTPGVKLLELTRKHHQSYCEKWDMAFDSIVSNVVPEWDPLRGSWAKVELVRQALEHYQYVVWMDADTLIWDVNTDLREGCGKGVGACWHRIPQLNHWNVGVMTFSNSEPVRKFMDEWKAGYPGERGWLEQGVFNKLAMASRVVNTLSDRWNATINVNEVPDAVILGYHGFGGVDDRYDIMSKMIKLIPQEGDGHMGTGARYKKE